MATGEKVSPLTRKTNGYHNAHHQMRAIVKTYKKKLSRQRRGRQ
jgi:hypothetical protein